MDFWDQQLFCEHKMDIVINHAHHINTIPVNIEKYETGRFYVVLRTLT